MNTLILRGCPLLIVALLAIGLPSLSAQESDTAEVQESSPLAGSWKWNRAGISGDVRCQIRFIEKDGKLTGTYEDADDAKAKVTSVSLDDDIVKVTLQLEQDGGQSEVTLEGKLDGDKITGKVNYASGAQDWKARRFVTLDDALGVWRLEFTTPDGQTMEPEFKLSVDDGEPTVEFVGDADDPSADAEITSTSFKNGYLTFEMELVFQDQPLELEYELEIMGDKLEGIMYFQIGDDELMTGEIDIDGTRVKK